MRRFSKNGRTQSWSTMSIDAIVESVPKSPTLSSRSSRDYDTGFPDSFCGSGNTTLRHPEANTSPDACISSSDIDVDHVFHRSRRSFLNKNKRTTLSHGKLTSAELETYNELSAIAELPSRTDVSSSSGSVRIDSRLSKDGGDSLNRPSSSAHSDTSAQQRVDGNNSNRPTTSHSGINRGGVFRKLRMHD